MANHIFEIESRIDQIAERLCKNFNYLPWVEKEEAPISYQQMVISTLALINSYSRLLKQANVEYLI